MKKITKIVSLVFLCNFMSQALADEQISAEPVAKYIAKKAEGLKPKIVKLAIDAFNKAKQNGIGIKKPIITVIDYTMASTKKRLWVIDINEKKVLYTSMVAHGKNSGENYTTAFSNKMGSLQTSVGVFLTENTYVGHCGYTLRLQGLEKGFNDKAKDRLIVFHGAPYVNKQFAAVSGRIGRSWGCPAVEKHLATPIINTIKDGTLIFSFANFPLWLKQSKFIKTQNTNA